MGRMYHEKKRNWRPLALFLAAAAVVALLCAPTMVRNWSGDLERQSDTAIQAGSAQGMCTMDGSLLNLYRQGRITKDTVTRFCLNHDATMRKLKNM